MEIKRPLKKPKLGPPDIYLQDPKQKEDELTSVNVKQGYTSAPLISGPNALDEFGSAKNANIDAFGVYFSALLSEKHRINTLKEAQKKKQLVNTKEIWYVHAKTKHAVDNWFRDLANGTKSLNLLVKKIPIFNSKEGMFCQLYESHVPLAKAVWFIKMSAVHAITLSESSAKSKKRQVPDQCQELTTALTKYLKDISLRMSECYQQSQHHIQQLQQQQQQQSLIAASQQPIGQTTSTSVNNPSSTAALNAFNNSQSILQQRNILKSASMPTIPSSLLNHQPNFTANLHTSVAILMSSHTSSAASLSAASISSLPILHEDFIPTYSQWQYQTQLARYLFDEGLLDQYDFLCFLLELIEKKRPINDLVVKIICPLLLEYVIDFSRSAVLSRRLAHVCARKLCQALHHHPMSARSVRKSEQNHQQQQSNSSMSTGTSFNQFPASVTDNLGSKHSPTLGNSNSILINKYNQFDSKSDTQSSSLLKNTSSSITNNNHLTANSILDIVKAQIIEGQNNFLESLTNDQENSENNLYKSAIYILSSIIQVICIECPTAMVRHHIVDAKVPSMYQGSPLDHLPCLPSSLPMMESDLNFELRRSIHDAEREILHRSAMADSKWSCDSSSGFENSKGSLVNRLLTVMDILDKHNFNKIESSSSVDILYSKIFPSLENNPHIIGKSSQNQSNNNQTSSDNVKNFLNSSGILDLSATSTLNQTSASSDHGGKKREKHQQLNSGSNSQNNSSNQDEHQLSLHNSHEEHVIKLLCEWATTTQRIGEHRALIVARLLEKRQSELQALDSALKLSKEAQSKTKKLEDLKTQFNDSRSGNYTESSKVPGCNNNNSSHNNSDKDQSEQEEIVQFTFQKILLGFLDENAPVMDETQDENNLDNKKAFNNLVLLFSELIRCDVFSHYNYMCTLISRGMFNDLSRASVSDNLDFQAPNSNLNPPGSVKQPKSISRDSESIFSTAGLTGSNSIYPLSVSTTNQLDPLSNNSNLNSGADQSLRSLGFSPVSSQNVSQNLDKEQGLLDGHIDDVDADLGKILQDIEEGQQDEVADILLPDYLSGMREDSNAKNQTSAINKLSSPFSLSDRSSALDNQPHSSTNIITNRSFPNPASVDTKTPLKINSNQDEKLSSTASKNPDDNRHMIFVKHFPVPDDENFMHDNNQRNILLYGFGKQREEARHATKKLNKEISNKLFHRKASRDINDGGKMKKVLNREWFNSEVALQKFELLNHHDQHIITNNLAMTIIEMFTGVSNGQTSSLPTLESISFVFDLFTMASNVSGLLELIVPILEELPDVEAQIKLKCPSLTNQYTNSIAICIIGMLYRYNTCVLLLPKEELCSIFDSLHKLVSHVSNPINCTTSAERVLFYYLIDLYSSQTGRYFDQYSSSIQRIKQLLQNNAPNNPTYNTHDYEWTPTFLITIADHLRSSQLGFNSSTNPIINASSGITSLNNFSQLNANDMSASIRQQFYIYDSPTIRQMNESAPARYRFVCDAVLLCATSPHPDLVNDIGVLCADVTAKCPPLMNDWMQVLQALCCSAQRELGYRQLLSKINISDLLIMDNIAIFTAILVARRCLELDVYIPKCAIGAIVAPLGPVDKQLSEPGVRLTCHILLALFRSRESPLDQFRSNFSSNNINQNFSCYGNNTPNYGGSTLNSVTSISGLLQTFIRDQDNSLKFILNLKYLCDHHLLRSACASIKTECLFTLLKAIRVLAMWANPSNDLDPHGRVRSENHFDDVSIDGINHLTRDLDNGSPSLNLESGLRLKSIDLQSASLYHFADAILRLLCSQRWLHDKCVSDTEIFTTTEVDKNLLLDPRMGPKQSQRLLYMICYNKSPEKQADIGLDDQGSDQVASIVKMFEDLDVWSMRLSLMRLQFMFAYCKSTSNVMLNDWLDNLAKAVVDFFQKASQESENPEKDNEDSSDNIKESATSNSKSTVLKKTDSMFNINKVWLIEPLLNKLTKPSGAVQSKIVKASASLMESASVRANSLPSLNQTYLSTAAASTKFKERTLSQRGSASTNPSNLASTSLLGFQPFLSLLLSCLKNQDKERETLLTSLNSQLYQAIHEKVDDIGYKQSLQDGLELRLCLIGQMFDSIQRSSNLTSDWATLLLLLIMNNLVDPQIDYGLYVSVLDMLATLIHSAYASDPTEQKEESKKQYQNLMKKFRKELTALEEKGFIQMKLINPLMPLARQMTEVITCEPMGSLVDTKGEKVENFYSIDKKKGLKVSELQEVSPWDLIEGHKNPAPLSWPWFGAIKLEQKPLRADENNRLMSWHTHSIRHTTAYFCQVPNVDDGVSSTGKRNTSEKKPSQSNPLLKSLIEASDENSILSKKESESNNILAIEDDSTGMDYLDNYHGCREDLVEDYCELPVDLLFDSTPIETMIEDIKTAMQAEQAALNSSSVKQQPLPQLAPIQSHPIQQQQQQQQPPPMQTQKIQPQPSPLPSIPSIQRPPSQPSPIQRPPSQPLPIQSIQSPLSRPSPVQPVHAPIITAQPVAPQLIQPQPTPIQPPLAAPQRAPKPRASKPRIPKPRGSQPRASAQIRASKPQPSQPSPLQRPPSQPTQIMTMDAEPIINNNQASSILAPIHTPDPNQRSTTPQVASMNSMQNHICGYYCCHPPNQHPGQQHHAQQQHPHQHHPQAIQQQQQSQHQNPQVQQQHFMQQQQQAPQQQHLQQHPPHQIQYQTANSQHQHHAGPPHPPQHMQSQQILLTGHQHQLQQTQQQTMPFQQIQQHPQQQMFTPQQTAGHSRPALTAMLHQKHAAAGNIQNNNKMHPQHRFNYN